MKLHETSLPGCLIIEQPIFEDGRGFFFETWNSERFETHGLPGKFVQSNVSSSSKGVVRGLHYQWPRPQGKLISVLEGEVYDVAVDLRRGSPNFGKWTATILDSKSKRQLWVPEGFAHGFAVLSESAVLSYLCTDIYMKDADAGVRWDDPAIGIEWPIRDPLLSEKDTAAPLLAGVPEERMPVFPP